MENDMKVYIYTTDPMLTLCYLPAEAVEMFGEATLEEYGREVPDALALEINETYEKLRQLSQKLKQYKD